MRQGIMRREAGFTIIELLIVVAIIGILAATVTAQLIRARASANEAATISSLRAIATAQMSYSQSCGGGAYATSLPDLGSPVPGTVPFLSPDLTTGVTILKSGYQLTLTAGSGANPGNPDCNGNPTVDGFYASGRPNTLNVSGSRSFAVATRGTIWQIFAALPPPEPFGPPATPIN